MIVLKKFRKIIACSLIVALFACAVPFKTLAAAGTIYESENNDVRTSADRTYDDYDNFGTISHASDVDWWVFTSNYTGFANFWLGSIPTGCDYDLYVYSANGTYMACSAKPSGTQEIVRCRVVSGYTYYAKVVTKGGYSGSQYKMRIKNNPIGYARYFSYNNSSINTQPTGEASIQSIWQMGYDGQCYVNNLAEPIYNTIPSSRIVVIDSHGDPGRMYTDATYNNVICGTTNSNMLWGSKSISSYESGALSEVRFVMFNGCSTGVYHSSFGNLVDQAINKGVTCAVGWNNTINISMSDVWTRAFFNACTDTDKNVANAATIADNEVDKIDREEAEKLRNRYYGSSNAGAIVI